MKQLLALFSLAILLIAGTNAQSNNAILFTENGEKFQVILNGILQNSTPETNVKMTQLAAPQYKCRIIFTDEKLGYVDFNMYFHEMGSEYTWNIKQNKKGEYVTRMVSGIPIAEAPPTPSSQKEIIFTTIAAPVATSTTTTTHTQTITTGNHDDVNINMGMNVEGQGGNIGISISGNGMDHAGSSHHSTTTTTHHSTTTTVISEQPVHNAPPQVVYVNGYNGKTGCPVPMSPADFDEFKNTVRSKDFEDTKETIAKQVLKNNCLTASQVKEVLSMFDFENTKLSFAKYAYDYTYDIGNYYKVNDAFDFETSVTELNNYISAKR